MDLKMRKKVERFCKFWLLFLSLYLPSQARELDFLLLFPGARATSLAGAFTARADDPTATHYNPGGLSFLSGVRWSFTHAHLLPHGYHGTFHEFLAISARPTDRVGIGLSGLLFIRGRNPPFQPKKMLNYVGFDAAAGASLGLRVLESLGLGATARYIYSLNIEKDFRETKGAGFSFDLSLLYKPIPVISLGTGLRNLGPDIGYIGLDEKARLPGMWGLGIEIHPLKGRWAARIGGEFTKLFAEPDPWIALSWELSFKQLSSLRAGWLRDPLRGRNGFTIGAGLRTRRFELDLGTDELAYNYPRSDLKLTISYKTD